MSQRSHHCNKSAWQKGIVLALSLFWAHALIYQLPAEAARKYVPKSASPAHVAPVKPQPQGVKLPPKEKPPAPPDLETLMAGNRYFEAIRWIDTHQAPGTCSGTLLLKKAQIYRYQQRYADSFTAYQAILNQPRCQAWHSAAQGQLALARLENLEKAQQEGRKEDLESGLPGVKVALQAKLHPTNSDPLVLAGLVRVALLESNLTEAQRLLQSVLPKSAENPEILWAKALWQVASGQSLAAKPTLYRLKAAWPHQFQVPVMLAFISLQNGLVDDAQIQLEKVLDVQPDLTSAIRLLASVYLAKGKPEEAQNLLEKCVALNPNDVKATEMLLKQYDEQKLSEQGLLLLKTLSTSAPNQPFYSAELMRRFLATQRTLAAWEVGADYVAKMNRQQSLGRLAPEWLSIFSRVVYQARSRSVAASQIRLHSSVQLLKGALLQRVRQKPGNLGYRVQLVRIDPFVTLPPIPYTYVATPERLGDALEIAFLEGDWPVYRRLLQDAGKSDRTLILAQRLLAIGDYRGASTLYHLNKAGVNPLLGQDIERLQAEASSAAKSLRLLPTEFSASQWKDAAQYALSLDPGNASLRAFVAQQLQARGDVAGAQEQYRLAALFATNTLEKQLWQRQSTRTHGKTLPSRVRSRAH